VCPSDERLKILNQAKGIKLMNKEKEGTGKLFKTLIMDRIYGATVRPEISLYPYNHLEVISSICLRDEFKLGDGDIIKIKIWIN